MQMGGQLWKASEELLSPKGYPIDEKSFVLSAPQPPK